MEKQIIETLEKFDYPISAKYLASQMGKERASVSPINSALYSMEKRGIVKKYTHEPPLWGKTV